MKKNLLHTSLLLLPLISFTQSTKPFCIAGYFSGKASYLDSFPVGKLTHIIFSFGHLKGNKLSIDNAGDTATIKKMVSLKKKYPKLKVILSLGGWGGCKDCSDIFSSQQDRREFAQSVKNLSTYFNTDGIDLDWEYPAISGFPGHAFKPADKENFTALVLELREALGKKQEISFAAGGFDQFIDQSIEWDKVMAVADKVYLMSYDLVHGFSKQTGHHTALYSTPQQEKLSANYAIKKLIEKGVPLRKIVIGAAFYARMFQVEDTLDRGLYRPGKFYRGVSYSRLYDSLSTTTGFQQYWDDEAKAPYAFNPARKIFVTYDDKFSILRKTFYAVENDLGGIMFWQLMDDKFTNGLLDAIHDAKIKAQQ